MTLSLCKILSFLQLPIIIYKFFLELLFSFFFFFLFSTQGGPLNSSISFCESPCTCFGFSGVNEYFLYTDADDVCMYGSICVLIVQNKPIFSLLSLSWLPMTVGDFLNDIVCTIKTHIYDDPLWLDYANPPLITYNRALVQTGLLCSYAFRMILHLVIICAYGAIHCIRQIVLMEHVHY